VSARAPLVHNHPLRTSAIYAPYPPPLVDIAPATLHSVAAPSISAFEPDRLEALELVFGNDGTLVRSACGEMCGALGGEGRPLLDEEER